jgi:hypothetical protein
MSPFDKDTKYAELFDLTQSLGKGNPSENA